MLAAKTRYLPRTRTPLIVAKCHRDSKMRGSAAECPGPLLEGFDPSEQRGQFQAFDKTPDRAHAMIVPREFLPADRAPLDLASLRGAKPRHRLATMPVRVCTYCNYYRWRMISYAAQTAASACGGIIH